MGRFNRDDNSDSRRDFGRRDFRGRGFGDRSGGGRREMHKAVCDECGKECEVPFEPTSGKPVYCSDCFEKREDRPTSPRNFQDRDRRRDEGPRRSNFERRPDSRPQRNDQLDAINLKIDRILELLTALPLKEEKKETEKPKKEVKIVDEKSTKVIKKKPLVKKK